MTCWTSTTGASQMLAQPVCTPAHSSHARRPEHLIVTHLAVPPVCIRPSVEMESAGSNEDDITLKLMQIIEARLVQPPCAMRRH